MNNLDCMSEFELQQFYASWHNRGWKFARQVFPDRQAGFVTATKDLANYAFNKMVAMQLRREGSIERALVYEAICERIYNRLPEFARW